MQNKQLTAQNAVLTALLEQAGLDAEASVVAARIQSVLTDEIHHRMKNMLAMVTAIVRQSVRSSASLAEAETAISARLIAMSKAHELLLTANLKSAALSAVIHSAIDQHNTAAGRIDIAGEELDVIPASILPLTLALNELCTNAVKYGALSNDIGRVALAWAPDAQGEHLVVTWTERGGPPVAPPGPRSFGTRLIADALPRQLGGRAVLDFAPSGLVFELAIPLDALRPAA
jgi:two-component sensor histidine kinase